MNVQRHELRLPDLGVGTVPIVASCWLVPRGTLVVEGDRLLEVLAGEVTVDLPAPATGTLVECRVEEDDPVQVGQLLAIIETPASSPKA